MNNRLLLGLLLLVVTGFIAGCGSAPTINKSQRLVHDLPKVVSVQFVYRKSDLHQVSSINRGSIQRQDHGYAQFGGLLVGQAGKVFEKYGVKVVESREIESADKLLPATATADTSPVLIIYAVKGGYSANRNNSRTSYLFEARLLDTAKGRLLWRAAIDTNTWSGDDFVLGNVKKTLYDETYAAQLLTVLAERMKSDQLI